MKKIHCVCCEVDSGIDWSGNVGDNMKAGLTPIICNSGEILYMCAKCTGKAESLVMRLANMFPEAKRKSLSWYSLYLHASKKDRA